MAFDLPASPNVGDLFQDSTTGAVYQWNGYAWVGGVTGIGLQTIKETRYLVAGSFTHTRDPKNSTGLGDIYLLGAQGGLLGATSAGNIIVSGGGGTGAIVIKFKYALAPTCPVVVGAGAAGLAGGASSFDGVLTANGGAAGATGTSVAGAVVQAAGGTPATAGSTGDENYPGTRGGVANFMNGIGVAMPQVYVYLRGIVRRGALGSVVASPLASVAGDPGAVFVVEYLSP